MEAEREAVARVGGERGVEQVVEREVGGGVAMRVEAAEAEVMEGATEGAMAVAERGADWVVARAARVERVGAEEPRAVEAREQAALRLPRT